MSRRARRLLLLQKLFRLRPCEDTFFANRSRPCLQYQINRCTGPCVGHVTPEQYARTSPMRSRCSMAATVEVIEDLGRRMDAAAEKLQYEQAARLRDQIGMLKQIQATQVMTRIAGSDIDAVGIAGQGGEFCVSVVFVRGGRNLGSSNYFPQGGLGDEGEMLGAFLLQYYLAREAPAEIVLSRAIEGAARAGGGAGGKGRASGRDPHTACAAPARAGSRWRATTPGSGCACAPRAAPPSPTSSRRSGAN